MIKLGKLEKQDLRAAWETEDRHFTPWLGDDDNINLLGEVLGLELEVEAQEADVGPFKADLVCRDSGSGALVLIENQLEKSDHKHLGQLMTYAAGLDAAYVVWIAGNIQSEHRAAMDWLNDITDEKFRFFGLELELWKIGESNFAPKFNIVAKPNDWRKNAQTGLKKIGRATSDAQQLQGEYWEQFVSYLNETKRVKAQPRPQQQPILKVAVGKSGVEIDCKLDKRANEISIVLLMWMDSADSIFEALHNQKENIEREIGVVLEWLPMPNAKTTKVRLVGPSVDISDRNNWSKMNEWFGEYIVRFDKAFRNRLKSI